MSDPKLTVFYDGACPLCAREISFYRDRSGGDQICWLDVSRTEAQEIPAGLSRDEALARFHVLTPEGRLLSGGAAFAQLWSVLPGFRLLGRISKAGSMPWLLEKAYVGFLQVRPWLQRRLRHDPRAVHDAPPQRPH